MARQYINTKDDRDDLHIQGKEVLYGSDGRQEGRMAWLQSTNRRPSSDPK